MSSPVETEPSDLVEPKKRQTNDNKIQNSPDDKSKISGKSKNRSKPNLKLRESRNGSL